MSDDSLFADPRPSQQQPRAVERDEIAGWQVSALRTALDEAGAVTMKQRRELVEELAGRPVAALRDLSIIEARAVSEGLAARKKSRDGTRDAWADRDGDTWIDRL